MAINSLELNYSMKVLNDLKELNNHKEPTSKQLAYIRFLKRNYVIPHNFFNATPKTTFQASCLINNILHSVKAGESTKRVKPAKNPNSITERQRKALAKLAEQLGKSIVAPATKSEASDLIASLRAELV